MAAGGELSFYLFAGAVLAGFVTPAEVLAQPSEYAIKAEFVERFTRFIDWPDEAFAGPDAPFALCVMGDDPFGDYLDRLARERKIKGRTVRLLHPAKPPELDDCHLAFIAQSESLRIAAIVARTQGKPILTIGDTPGFAQVGVIINFFLDRDLVRFEINLGEAKQSGLVFSAKLLKLGRVVGPPPGGP